MNSQFDAPLNEINFSNSRYYIYRCNFGGKHVMKEPIVLPCGFKCCMTCFTQHFKQDKQACCKCSRQHDDVAVYVDGDFRAELRANAVAIAEETINSILEYERSIDAADANREDKCVALRKIIRSIMEDRVADIRDQLDILKDEFRAELNDSKAKVMREVKPTMDELELKQAARAELEKKIESMTDQESIEREKVTLKELNDRIDKLNSSIQQVVRRNSFEPSDWMPDESFLATVIPLAPLATNVQNAAAADDDDVEAMVL